MSNYDQSQPSIRLGKVSFRKIKRIGDSMSQLFKQLAQSVDVLASVTKSNQVILFSRLDYV